MTMSLDDLTIDDLLRDPMTQAIMQADGVDSSELETMLRALAARLARPAGQSNDDAPDDHAVGDDALDAERVPFDRNAVGRSLLSISPVSISPVSISPGRSETSRRVAARSSFRPQLCRVL
jgi:hypothetical protein